MTSLIPSTIPLNFPCDPAYPLVLGIGPWTFRGLFFFLHNHQLQMAEAQCAPALDCSRKHCSTLYDSSAFSTSLIYSFICISYILCLILSWVNGSHQMNTGSSLLHHIYVLSWICPLLYLCQNGKLPVFLFLNPGMSPCPPPPVITTPARDLDLYGQCVGSSFFKAPCWTHISFLISPPLFMLRSTSEPQFQHQVVQAETGNCPWWRLTALRLQSADHSSAFQMSPQPPSPACQHFLSGLYHCLWTVSPLLFMLPRLPSIPQLLKHGCHILLLLQTLTFVPLKPKIKILPSVWSDSCHSGLISYLLPSPHCVLARGLVRRSGLCPVFCSGRPMRLDSHPLLSFCPLTAPNSASPSAPTQSKLRKTELWLISFWTI